MGFSTERNHDLAPSLAVMDRSGFGGRRSLPDALQSPETSGMIFQEQAFWANVVLRKSTLSRLLILHQRSEKNSLAIVQAACVVAPKIDLYETKLANNIALGALEKIGGKSLKTPYVLTIIQDFFKKRNLQSEVLYDTPFCILFRDESIATRIEE